MAPSSSRSSPLPVIVGGLVILILAAGVMWILDEPPSAEAPADARLATVADDQPQPDRVLPEGVATHEPEPLAGALDRAQVTPPPDVAASWDDPVVITGWVEDGEQKRLPDIDVNLFDDLGEYLDSVITDEEGAFAFNSDVALPAGWSLGTEPELVDPDDPDAVVPAYYIHAHTIVPGDVPVKVRLVLDRPPRIEGRVYDAVTREPIELADVEVVCMSPAWEAEFQDTYTDESGSFAMTLVDVPARDIILKVEDDDDRYAIIGPMTLAPGEVRFFDVPLAAPLQLEGTVRSSADGSPIDGAEIMVLPAHIEFEGASAWDVTGDDGSWFIEDIGVPPDRIWIYAQADDYGPALVKVDGVDEPVDVRLGDLVTVNGRVIDANTGDAVMDAIVRIVLRGPSGLLDDMEDMEFVEDDGSFSIELELTPPAGAEIFVESDEHVRFRARLSDLAPTDLGLRSYDVSVTLQPLPVF